MTRHRWPLDAIGVIVAGMATICGGLRAHAAPDLRAHAPPAVAPRNLTMRPVAQGFGPATPPPASPSATIATSSLVPAPRGDGARDGGDDPSGSRLRQLGEHVVFHVRAGLAVDARPTSGQAMRTGATPGELPGDDLTAARPLREQNAYVLGDAVLGSRGLPVSSLNTYFAAQFRLGLSGTSDNATRADGWDGRGDNAMLLQTGYAELDGWGHAEHWLHPLFLRAGRQFHFGGAQLVSQFDGAHLAWRTPDWELGGFVGRRVALWGGDAPGIVGGARARVGLERLIGVPLSLVLDVLTFESERVFVGGDAALTLGPVKLSAQIRGLDAGQGFGLGRAGARLRWAITSDWSLRADVTAIRAHEVAYDWLAPQPVDIVDVREGIALALPAPTNALRVGGSLGWTVSPTLELYGFGRMNASSGTGLNAPWLEAGGAGETRLTDDVTASAQLKVRLHQLGEVAGQGGEFADLTGSGTSNFVELAAEARYRPRKGALRVVAAVYARRASLRTPYVEIDGDVRGGARLDAELGLGDHARLRAVAEAAQPSLALAPELDLAYALRLIAEASF